MLSPLFLNPEIAVPGIAVPASPIYSRSSGISAEQMAIIDRVQRGDFTGFSDPNQAIGQVVAMMANLNRAITSATSNLPIRENLEVEVASLVPSDTPLRNRIPRIPGSGTAVKWRQLTSYGGGYGATTTTTSGAGNNATANAVVTSAAGMRVGDFLAVGSGATLEVVQITAISGTAVTVSPAFANDQRSVAVSKVQFNAGGGAAARVFFGESGAPGEFATTYAAKTASYKLLGTLGSVTGFAMAAGANFQNQLATEKTNSIRNTMLNEENAIINGDSSATAAPWGDGTNALAFDGLINLITTANGVPADQIQVSVGQLTTAHLDAQLTRLYYQGAQDMWIVMAGQEIKSLAKIATGGSNNYRIMIDPKAATLGTAVVGYLHPITGQLIPIIPSRFLSPGTILFGADRLPMGTPALQMNVLPQVQLPELAPNVNIQGYTAQEIAPAAASPQVYPFITTVYEVLQMRGSIVFAKSTGVTPA